MSCLVLRLPVTVLYLIISMSCLVLRLPVTVLYLINYELSCIATACNCAVFEVTMSCLVLRMPVTVLYLM